MALAASEQPSAEPAGRLRVLVSIRRERLPRPGLASRAWAWEDVLEAPPPPRSGPKASAFVVRHGFDGEAEDPDQRVGYATLVRFRADGEVRVEERVTVEPRVLSGVLRAEHAVHRRVDATSRAGDRVAAWGARVAERPSRGRVRLFVGWLFIALGRALAWSSRLVADAMHALVEAPDRLWASATIADAHLKGRRERRALLAGLLDPYALSREGKAAALFLVATGLAGVLLAMHVGITLAWPEAAEAWRALFGYFVLGVASTVAFPFFPEFQLHDVIGTLGTPWAKPGLGPALAILTITTAMTAGAWIVLFLGDEIHGSLRRSVRPGSQVARVLDRAEAFAARHGFWAAFLTLSIPLGPDTPVFYTLATVRTPPRQFLLGAFLGLLVRFTLFWGVPILYYGVLMDGYYL